MADQLAGQWYADATGLGDLAARATGSRPRSGRSTACNVCGFAGGRMGAVNGMRPDGTRRPVERAVGRGLGRHDLRAGRVHDRARPDDEGWATASGAAAVTYERGLWFRTPEAYDEAGNFRASLYLRPLAIWAIEEALERRGAGGLSPLTAGGSGSSPLHEPADPPQRLLQPLVRRRVAHAHVAGA